MDPRTIREKLRPPALPASYLPRPRLARLWQERSGHRLLLVTAGAGYGKTTFLAERAREEADAVLWFWVDENDTHPRAFAGHLAELLQAPAVAAAYPFGGRDEPSAPPWPGESAGTATAGSMQRLLAATVAALRERGRTLLIIDDAHLLQASSEMLRFLETLARYLPETATLVLASREPLAIGAMRARTAGRAAAIDARDLAFRADEVAALFELRQPGLRVSPSLCRRVLAATEG